MSRKKKQLRKQKNCVSFFKGWLSPVHFDLSALTLKMDINVLLNFTIRVGARDFSCAVSVCGQVCRTREKDLWYPRHSKNVLWDEF